MEPEGLRAPSSTIFRPLSAPVLAGLGTGDDSSEAPLQTSTPISLVPSANRSSRSATPPSVDLHHNLPPLHSPVRTNLSWNHPPLTDLGDDDLFDPAVVSGYMPDLPSHSAQVTSAGGASLFSGVPASSDIDHRKDAVYDELDDIDGWVAQTAPAAGTDLTKRVVRGFDRIAAGKTVAVHERAETRRREHHAKDKLDRATVELVLDPRTRMILFRLLSRGRLRTLDGCVSTGKEANVYYATAAANASTGVLASRSNLIPRVGLLPEDRSPDAPVAVKVYKTSILQFKDRERYVAGEFRFRRGGYNRSSNRKMVQQWAEKEYRNLVRLQDAGIPCPVPLLLKPPVLVMSFYGRDGWPAPLLKDASLSGSRLEKAYFRVCVLMRRMFHGARLVHGDLSEYNMLFWNSEVIIIDVSQSVEHDHPMALDFLRRDCSNVNDFFEKNGVHAVLGLRQLFDYITGTVEGHSETECADTLRRMLDDIALHEGHVVPPSRQDDNVFMQAYIPRTLQDVQNHEAEIEAVVRDGPDAVLYGKLTGLSISQNNYKNNKHLPSDAVDGSREKRSSEERLCTPRPTQLLGALGGGSSVGCLEFEEDNFDECNEPIATRLPSLAGKSSKSSSESSPPYTPQVPLTTSRWGKHMKLSKSSSGSSPPHTPQVVVTDIRREGDLRLHLRSEHDGLDTASEATVDESPISTHGGSHSNLDFSARKIASGNRLSAITQKLQGIGPSGLQRVFGGPPARGRKANEAEGAENSSETGSEALSDRDESTYEFSDPEMNGSDVEGGDNGGENNLENMTKKEWKKHVKLEARERRENKIPKHVKKRREALAKRRRGTKTKK